MKLSIRLFNGNATVYGTDEDSETICMHLDTSADGCCEGFTLDECIDNFRERIIEYYVSRAIDKTIENLDGVLEALRSHLANTYYAALED